MRRKGLSRERLSLIRSYTAHPSLQSVWVDMLYMVGSAKPRVT